MNSSHDVEERNILGKLSLPWSGRSFLHQHGGPSTGQQQPWGDHPPQGPHRQLHEGKTSLSSY